MKTKLLFSIIIFTNLFLTGSSIYSQTSIPGGFVSGTWTQAGSPYLVMGSVQIPNDSTLIIEPGVDVIFQGAYKLLVMGRLLAEGTQADSITFTAVDTSIGWRGIKFNNTLSTNDSSILSYCRIIKSKAITPPEESGGGLYINDFYKLRVSDCLIYQCQANFSGGGIWCGSSSGYPHIGPFFYNNTIKENTCNPGGVCYNEGGGGIYSNGSASPVIKGNVIADNSAYGYCAFGGGIMAHSFNVIENNVITGNYAQVDGGGMRVMVNNHVKNNVISYNSCGGNGGGIDVGAGLYSGNIISNNTAVNGGGMYFHYGMSIQNFNQNIICNNSSFEGGGIYVHNSTSFSVLNSNIVNNHADKGGAMFSKENSNVTFRNCIVHGNDATTAGSQFFLFDDSSDPNLYYCNLEGGSAAIDANGNFYTGVFQNNINADPLFVNPTSDAGVNYDGTSADWSLQSISPCIEAGDPSFADYTATDFSGGPRLSDCRIDMGVYEYFQGAPFVLSLIQTAPVACHGYSTAILHADVSGSQLPYSYEWSTGDTSAIVDSLPAGFYAVTVSSATGCVRNDTITVTQPNGMYIEAFSGSVSCSGQCDGSVNVHVWWGGTSPYSYLWNTTPTQTTAVTTFTLCPGNYCVTVTDSLGCQDTACVNLTSPNLLTCNVTYTNVTCNGANNGSIYLNATGGSGAPYNYSFNGGVMWGVTNSMSILAPGTYSVMARDMSGCITPPQEIIITEPYSLNVTASITDESCYNGNNGVVALNVTGGTPSYSYLWSISGQGSVPNAAGVTAGHYFVTVTDSKSCQFILPFTVGVTLDSPFVCIVTVDTLSWKNAVIWEKPITGGITEFNIYKEISVNNYGLIGTVAYSDPAYFVDNTSVPEAHGDKYKITAVDTCENESPFSPFHKTMNLTIAAFGSTMGLNWDDYVDESGDFVPPTYYIYRGTTPSQMTLKDSVSGSFNSYNDLNVYSVFYYMIGVKKTSGCNNTKSVTVSFSNKKDNSGMSIGENNYLYGTILISPNPMSTSATLTIPNLANSQWLMANGRLQISDLTGKVVRCEHITPFLNPHGSSPDEPSHAQLTIERGDLKPGIYFVELNADRVYRGKFVVE